MAKQQQHPVIIVGAGLAGLYAAYVLRQQNVPVTIVEAADYVGGRCKQVTGFTEFDIDVGGEFVHGHDGELNRIISEQGWEMCPLFDIKPEPSTKDEYKQEAQLLYLGRERRLVPFHTEEADIKKMRDLLAKIETEPLLEKDETLLQFLASHGLPWRVLSLADAVFAKYWASAPDLLSVKGLMTETARWVGGSGNFRLKKSYRPLVELLKQDADILLNWQVKHIDYRHPEFVILTNQRDESLVGSAVIVTVPITVWRDGDIKFNPPLPAAHAHAVRNIGMSHAMKVIVQLKRPVWPRGCRLVLCADSFAPQVWFDGGELRGSDTVIATAFISGPEAGRIMHLEEQELVDLFLRQLDDMFGSENNPNPATREYAGYRVFNWSKHPFIRGAYSFPMAAGMSDLLAQPISDHVFVAGEATAYGCVATIKGAIQSGRRAAEQVLRYRPLLVQPPQARL